MDYYLSQTVDGVYEEVIQKVTENLKEIGFGVITTIDMHQKLKEKLGVDFRRYKILGACNPEFAYKAINVSDRVGVLLPCNVVIQELEKNKIEILAINPNIMSELLGNDEFKAMASEISIRFKKAISI